MFDFRFGNGRVVSINEGGITATDAEIPVTKDAGIDRCADCGEQARIQFSLKFVPWKYVVTCKKCGQQSGYHDDATEATAEWNRRQREKMANKGWRRYLVVNTYRDRCVLVECNCMQEALEKAKEYIKDEAVQDVYVTEIIAKSKTTRGLVFTDEGE